MSPKVLLQLAVSAAIFLGAAGAAKSWAVEPASWKLVVALVLYTAGNLVTLRLAREFGLVPAFAVSGLFQLIAVTVMACALFADTLNNMERLGISLGLLSVLFFTLAPWMGWRRW